MSEPRARPPAGLVPALARAAAVLDVIEQTGEPFGLAALAATLKAPKSSLHGLCNTMVALGYLRRLDDGTFFIGPRVMGLAHVFAARSSPVREFASMTAAGWFGPDETVILSVLDGAEVLYMATRTGTQSLGLAFSVGMRWPAHRAATGRAMLSLLDEVSLKRLYPSARVPAFMNLPPRPRVDLLRELAEIREQGYAIDDEAVRQNVYCVAAPVFDASRQGVAGLVVCQHKAARKARGLAMQRDSALRAARELSVRLGAPPHGATPTVPEAA